MEIYLTKYALNGSIILVDATINPKTRIATETDNGVKHAHGSYEVTLDAAVAEARARIRAAADDAERKAQYLRTLPLQLDWEEQGKPKFKMVMG